MQCISSHVWLSKTLVLHLTVKTHISNLNSAALVPLVVYGCHAYSCLCLCSFMPWLLLFSAVWLSSVSLKQTIKKIKTMLLALFWELPKLTISYHLAQIQHKFVSVCYNCLNPSCLTELPKVYKPARRQCSSDTSILCLPYICTHALSEIFFLFCTVCQEQSPLWS